MNNEKQIKIFISCHKECNLLRNKYIQPIQVGCSVSGQHFNNMFHDDDGDNISYLNPMYCELTAQYWAWKNVDADYYGFMHYRRYFSFNPNLLPEDPYGNIVLDDLSADNLKKLYLDEETVRTLVPQYDVITLIPNEMRYLGAETVYQHAKEESPFHRIEDLDKIIDIINTRHPEYKSSAEKYLNSSYGYFCNMYILRKEIFQAYCEWLFDILETHRKTNNFDEYSIDEYRVSGFWAERLWGIYYTYLQDTCPNLKCKEVQKTFFKNTDRTPDVYPVFAEKNIPIVLAADNNYVPMLATTIKSIAEHASSSNNYDLVVFQQNISEKNQKKIQHEFENHNFSIRFINVGKFFKGKNLVTPAHFTIEIYFRLVIHNLLNHYEKVVYLDSDLVVNEDIANLYNTELGDNLVAAVRDVDSAGCYKAFDPTRQEYFRKNLKLKNPYSYFNSGVLLMNLREFRKLYKEDDIFRLASNEELLFPDQDVLNILCEDKVLYLDGAWNTMMNHEDCNTSRLKVARLAPHDLYKEYIEARKNPKIIHFAGYQKPWLYPDSDMAEYFWKYAMQTTFFPLLITMGQKKETSSAASKRALIENNRLKNIVNATFPFGSKRRNFLKRLLRQFKIIS